MSRPNWIGQSMGGRYQIEALLGQGGMSAVYRGTDPNLHRTVAIKLIHSHLTGDPEFLRRFEAEAAAVAQLRHSNIIQVYDFNHDDDVYYMVLEFVPGETLHARLRRAGDQGLPLEEALEITAGVADAVDYAHKRGLIHRDIKPANIMLSTQGQPILMDFGIAKILGGAQHTATGAVVGTASYISPEQVLGQRPTERSDIYSLGVTLFEMVAGRPPFEADSAMSLMMKHVNEMPPDCRTIKPAIPADVVAIVDRALAKDPAHRYASAALMASALRDVAGRLRAGRMLESPATLIDEAPPVERPRTSAQPARPVAAPLPPKLETGTSADVAPAGRRGFPRWALVVLPIIAILCLALGASGGLALMTSLRTALVPATPTVSAATVAPTQPGETQLPPATEAQAPTTDTPPAAPTATAPAAATVPPNMLLLPAGAFQMGSAAGAADEQPVHAVKLDAFFIDTFEVTNARYQACLNDGGCTALRQNGSETRGAYFANPEFNEFPVVSPTWDQARAYCLWDGGKRLPTEAEWEYAATGGDGRRFPWGNDFDANLVPSSAPDTVAIGSFPGNASPFGPLDMAGNVLEWVADVYDSNFYAESPEVNPQGPGAGADRVLRGGSFGTTNGAVYTTTRRFHLAPNTSEVDVGFRCALAAP